MHADNVNMRQQERGTKENIRRCGKTTQNINLVCVIFIDIVDIVMKQAGAELGQAQYKIG